MSESWTVSPTERWVVQPRTVVHSHSVEWVYPEQSRATPRRKAFRFVCWDTEENATDDSLKREFEEHAAKWASETEHLSSIQSSAMHPSYQRIMGMGERAVPLILRELKVRPNHWFWALRYITNENPVKPKDAGNFRKMVDAWLEWGKKRGLL